MKRINRFFRNIALAVGIAAGAGAVSGCQNWETNLENKLQDKGFSHEQAEVGAAVGLRRVFTKKVEDEKKGTVTYEFNYNVLKDDEVLQVVEDMYSDVKDMLDYDGGISYQKYLKNSGRGDHLEKEEKILKYLKDMIREKVLHRKFERLTGGSSSWWSGGSWGGGYYDDWMYDKKGDPDGKVQDKQAKPGDETEKALKKNHEDEAQEYYGYGGYGNGWGRSEPEDQFKVDEKQKLTLADLFPNNRPKREFETDEVKKARERGDLNNGNFKVEEINTVIEFWEKVDNPQYLVDHGEKRWKFKKRRAGVSILGFNVDGDKEKKTDYIEVFRLRPDGKRESKPAVKMFRPSGSERLEVIVADRDFEGEGGYGVPDWVGRPDMFVENARDLMEFQELLDFIFQKKRDEEKREKPNIDLEMNKLYIVKAGTLPMNSFACGDECFERFLPDYKKGPNGSPTRYMVHVRRDIPDEIEEHEKMHKGFPIKWVALQYMGGRSRVVEFYKVKKEFAGKDLKTNVFGTRVSIEDETGLIRNYDVKAVIEDKPYQIAFDRNRQKRWTIKDEDGDGKCFECKKVEAWTNDVIPDK